MTEVGVRDLKDRLSEHLRAVKAGEEVVVTEHGRPVARLVRYSQLPAWLETMAAQGLVQLPDGTKPRGARVKLRGNGPSASDYVIRMRGRY